MHPPEPPRAQSESGVEGIPHQINELPPGSSVNQQGQTVGTQYNVVGNAIFRIRQYIEHPPTFYSDLRSFVGAYWIELALLVVTEAVVLAAYYRFQGPYLIPVRTLAMAAPLSAVAIIFGAAAVRARRSTGTSRTAKVLLPSGGLIALLLFAGTVGNEGYRILNPVQFGDDEFGIAVATFGYGPRGGTSRRSYEISSLIESKLDERLSSDSSLSSRLRVIRTGLLTDHDRAEHNRHNAKLVIWGHLTYRGPDLEAKFTLLPTESLIDTPQFPQPIPLYERMLRFSTRLTYGKCQDPEAAIEALSAGVAAFSIGLAEFHAHQPDRAVGEFEDAIKSITSTAEGCELEESSKENNLSLLSYFLGRSYQALGEYETAQEHFNDAEQGMGEDPALLFAEIYNYRVFGQEEKRQEAYRTLLKISSNPPEGKEVQAKFDQALAHQALEDLDLALDAYEDIIADDPTFFVAYLGAGSVLARQEKYDAALTILAEADAIAADDPVKAVWLLMTKGLTYAKRKQPGDLEQAQDLFNEAIEIDRHTRPDGTEGGGTTVFLHFYLADVLRQLGKEEALQEYQTVIDLSPVRNWSFSTLAEYQFEIGDYRAAIKNYETALLYPAYSNKILYARLGMAYAYLDDPSHLDKEQRAIDAFESALVEPGEGDAYVQFEYGRALFNFGKDWRQDGIKHMELALAIEEGPSAEPRPTSMKTRRNLGQMYRTAGDEQGAIEMFSSLVEYCDLAEPEQLEFALEQLREMGVTGVECRVSAKG